LVPAGSVLAGWLGLTDMAAPVCASRAVTPVSRTWPPRTGHRRSCCSDPCQRRSGDLLTGRSTRCCSGHWPSRRRPATVRTQRSWRSRSTTSWARSTGSPPPLPTAGA